MKRIASVFLKQPWTHRKQAPHHLLNSCPHYPVPSAQTLMEQVSDSVNCLKDGVRRWSKVREVECLVGKRVKRKESTTVSFLVCRMILIYVRCGLTIGLHASISIHICHDYLDQSTGEWAPNLECFISRLASHPERLSNVYFNAVLLTRAIARAAPYLEAYDIGTAPLGRTLDAKEKEQCTQDLEAKEALRNVLGLAAGDGMQKAFDEGDFFAGQDAPVRSLRPLQG